MRRSGKKGECVCVRACVCVGVASTGEKLVCVGRRGRGVERGKKLEEDINEEIGNAQSSGDS